jgi:Phosphoadenosine phosphosulfate reductase family
MDTQANPHSGASESERQFGAAHGYPSPGEITDDVLNGNGAGGAGVGGVTTLKSGQMSFLTGRVLVWFSCGAPSAVAAKLAVEKYRGKQPVEVLYCDTLKYEHPDNPRFMADVAAWLGQEIKLLRSDRYADIFDVFDRTGWLVGPHGAKCTEELKREVRKAYQWAEDTHVFGYRADEAKRIALFESENPGLFCDWLLPDSGMTQSDCYRMLREAGIALPAMYRMGYRNNNCIGCVKGQMGYWNKIRRDFPESFARMALQERKMNAAINKRYEGEKRIRVFLDECRRTLGATTKSQTSSAARNA